MILAAADPGVGTTFTLVGALCAVGVGVSLAGLVLFAAWTTRGGRKGRVERWLDRRLDRRTALSRALNNGDQRALHAVTEQEHAHRERVTVPRRIIDRSHR